MECVCFESACGSRCCRITPSNSAAASLTNIAVRILLCLLLQFTVYLFWPAHWPWLCAVPLLASGCIYSLSQCLPRSECLLAVSGVGMYITKSFGPLTSSSFFIPQTRSHKVIIFEAISKYQIDFVLGVQLDSDDNFNQSKDILVPLLKTCGSLSLKDIHVAYKHLTEITDKT